METTQAISYWRWSSPEQSSGDSKRRQEEAFQRFCSTHQLEPIGAYTDAGVSGWSRAKRHKRKGLEAFLEAVEAGTIPQGSVLVVEGLDRLSRYETDEGIALFSSIIRSGIDIGVVRTGRIYTRADLKGMGIVEAVIALVLANQESEQKSDRCKQAYANKRQTASKDNPFKRKACVAWFAWKDGQWVETDKATIVRKIIDMALHGSGCHSITKWLIDNDISTLVRGKWFVGNVARLLHSRTLLGEFCGHADYYPPMITPQEFDKLQGLMEARNKRIRGRTGHSVANLFTGLLRDEHGNAIHLCKGMLHSHGKSDNGAFPYASLEKALLRWTKELTPQDLNSKAPTGLEALESDIVKTERKMNELQGMLLNTDESISILADTLRVLDSKLKAQTKERDKLRREQASIATTIPELRTDTTEERLQVRMQLQGIIQRIECRFFKRERGRFDYCASIKVSLKSGVIRYIGLVQNRNGQYWAKSERDEEGIAWKEVVKIPA